MAWGKCGICGQGHWSDDSNSISCDEIIQQIAKLVPAAETLFDRITDRITELEAQMRNKMDIPIFPDSY